MPTTRSLDNFKTLNLIDFAEDRGYVIDERESSKASGVMRNQTGDKIIIARRTSGHWVYFSVRDDTDNGTIVDFLLHRGAGNLGEVRRELERWTHAPSPPLRFARELTPVSKDREGVCRRLAAMEVASNHPYLAARVIDQCVTNLDRFAGAIFRDLRGNAVFPHQDEYGVCGYEVKNNEFTGFATGGNKALWVSQRKPSDTTLVLAESAIDALSYAALHGITDARHASTAGSWSDKTWSAMHREIVQLVGIRKVILAFDNDPAGRAFVTQVRDLFTIHRVAAILIVDLPQVTGADWNDVLRITLLASLPASSRSR